MYKLYNLFRSIRVSDENSSVTRELQCFLTLFELQPIFAFNMHHSKRRHQFPTRSDIICCFSVIYRFVYRERNDLKLKITTKWTVKMLKFSMVLPFHPHSMCERVERFTTKIDALRVQTGQSLSEYQGFGWELFCYTGGSLFLNLFELRTSFVFNMEHSKRRDQFPTGSDIICCFSVIYRFV